MPGVADVLLSVGSRGVKETVGKDGLGGALISSDGGGFTAGAGRLSISAAFGATEGGRRGLLFAKLFVLPAVPRGEVDEGVARPSGLVGTSFVVFMTGVSWALLKINGFGGATTSAGRLT